MVTLYTHDGGKIEAGILEGDRERYPAWSKYCEHVKNENGEYWEVLGVFTTKTGRNCEIICKYCAQRRGIIW